MRDSNADKKRALDIAGEARRKAMSAARTLETAFEQIDDYGPSGASRSVASAARELRVAAELLEKWGNADKAKRD